MGVFEGVFSRMSSGHKSILSDFSMTTASVPDALPNPNILHRPPILEKFDQNLGNAGSRSKEQAERARLLALDRICQAGEDLVIFTDGSALSNPGPCGAGTVIYWRGITHDRSSYGRPVSKHSNSFHAELQAIDLALQTVTEAYPVIKKPVLLLSDCQGALTVTADPIAPANFTGLYYSIQDKIHTLREQGSDIKLHWIAGHADIEGNEEADIKAKEAATEASSPSFTSMLKSWSEAKARVKSKAMERWKSRRKKSDAEPSSSTTLSQGIQKFYVQNR